MPMQWNEQADAKLFANVLKLHVVKLDYQALAKAMGETVTPKAISHRIAKIKEKAQARRSDWEAYRDPSCTPRKRGLKAKATDDDEDDVPKKRIKSEETIIKAEEDTSDNSRENPASGSTGDYFWSSRPPTIGTEKSQQCYEPYESEAMGINGATGVDYENFNEDCTNVNVGAGSNVGPHVGHSGFLTDYGNAST